MGFVIGNIYVITTVAVIGGALFGFDIASMSAMYDSGHDADSGLFILLTLALLVSELSSTNASSTRLVCQTVSAVVQPHPTRVASRLPCLVAPSLVPLSRVS